MFIGHFGIGLGAKKAAPKISLGTLFLAAQFLDLLWPVFLLLGWERVQIQRGITKMAPLNFSYYPFSHSLLMACIWGILIGFIYFFFRKNSMGAFILGLCVVSHWFLDLLVHRHDLSLFPGETELLGLGLWNYPAIAVLLEVSTFIFGLILYLRTTKAINKKKVYGFWALIAFLVLIYVSNLLGPAPTNIKAIAWAGVSQWLLVIWAYWVDRNRELKETEIDK